MKNIKGLIAIVSMCVFSIVFVFIGTSCSPKKIDLRYKGSGVENTDPTEGNPSDPDPDSIDPEKLALSDKKIYTKVVSGD